MDLNGDTVRKRQHIVVFVAIVNVLRLMYTSQKKYYVHIFGRANGAGQVLLSLRRKYMPYACPIL